MPETRTFAAGMQPRETFEIGGSGIYFSVSLHGEWNKFDLLLDLALGFHSVSEYVYFFLCEYSVEMRHNLTPVCEILCEIYSLQYTINGILLRLPGMIYQG